MTYPGNYISEKQALFDTQIVVTKQLDKETHRTLRILSKHVREEDVRAFVEKAAQISEPGDRNNVDAVLQVSVSANKEIYEAISLVNNEAVSIGMEYRLAILITYKERGCLMARVLWFNEL